MRLRRTFLVLFGVTIVVLAGGLFYAYQANEDAIVDREQGALNRTADEMATALDKHLEERIDALYIAADNPAVVRWNSTGQRRTLEGVLDHAGVGGISVIAANGTMMAIRGVDPATRDRLVGRTFDHREYFQRAMAGEAYVSDPLDAESGNTIVTISVPIERDGRVIGTLNAAFHLTEAHFFPDTVAFHGDSTGRQVVVAEGPNENATTLYRSRESLEGSTISRSAAVSSTGWTVTVARSKPAMLAPVRKYETFVTVLAIVILGMIGVAGAWTFRTNVRQIERLDAGLDALREGNYGEGIDVGGSVEWESIDDTYEALRQAIPERERQLRVLDRVLRHNLRNDMDVILGYAERIRENGNGEAAESAESIIESGTRLLDTVAKEREIVDVLTVPQPAERTDLVETVDRTVRTVRADHPEATIEVDLPPAAGVVGVGELDLAVEELVRNAVVHSDRDGPVVSVDVEVGASTVDLRVRDRGPGIPEQVRAVLTADREIDQLFHGSGLGLWLVNWIVRRSEGRLQFDERDPRGSIVTVTLPRADPAGGAPDAGAVAGDQ